MQEVTAWQARLKEKGLFEDEATLQDYGVKSEYHVSLLDDCMLSDLEKRLRPFPFRLLQNWAKETSLQRATRSETATSAPEEPSATPSTKVAEEQSPVGSLSGDDECVAVTMGRGTFTTRPGFGGKVKCGHEHCLCEQEGLDIHMCEPLLPAGFFLVVSRCGERLKMMWAVQRQEALVEENSIDKVIGGLWSEHPSAVYRTVEEEQDCFMQHKINVKAAVQAAVRPSA
jgi:hypothetical protein